jgi:hypothetical protein
MSTLLDELTPVSLDDLAEQASLLTRVDRKYVLTAGQARALTEQVPSGTRVLQIDGRRDFGYRSVYLDTRDHASFLSSGRSQRRRWKARTRAYLDTGSCWLEVKTRSPRGLTVKQRIVHPDVEDHGGLGDDGRTFVAGVIGPAAHDLQPVLVTAYRRSTLLLPGAASRVTIDLDLGWTSLQAGGDLDRPDLAIVETKTGSTPSAVDRLLWSRGHRPVRISKYGVGMAALHADLPRLKWHRAMNRHLGIDRAA